MMLAEVEELASQFNALAGWCALLEENVSDGGYQVRAWNYRSRCRHTVHMLQLAKQWQAFIRARGR